MDDTSLLEPIDNKLKIICITNLINTILLFILVMMTIFYIVSSSPYHKPNVSITVYNSSLVGIGIACLSGMIESSDRVQTEYYFEYGLKYYNLNNTEKSVLNAESNNVSQIISDLIPNTEYEYRLVSVIGNINHYVSDKYYFKTLSAPIIKFDSVTIEKNSKFWFICFELCMPISCLWITRIFNISWSSYSSN